MGGFEAVGIAAHPEIEAINYVHHAGNSSGIVDGAAAVLLGSKKAGMSPSDIDIWELNEAFASVVLRYMQALDLDHDKINVNGGAIAMGHPLGATGAIVLGTVLDEMERRELGTALVTLCIGAGMGTATIIERV
jgi:acetyl-CoA C-acetyltransferase